MAAPWCSGHSQSCAVEQISGTMTFLIPFHVEPELVLHVLQGSLSLQAPRAAKAAGWSWAAQGSPPGFPGSVGTLGSLVSLLQF